MLGRCCSRTSRVDGRNREVADCASWRGSLLRGPGGDSAVSEDGCGGDLGGGGGVGVAEAL